jgi:phosphoribosylanthranilate isomerase
MENVATAPIEAVLEIRSAFVESMAEVPEFEEVVRLDANYALQREALLNLLDGEESGEFGEDDVDVSVVQFVDDHATNQLEIFGMEMQVEIDDSQETMADDAEMSSSAQYATFSQGYGEILAGLIERTYENPQDGITDVATAGGLTPADVQGAIQGQLAFDPDTNSAIAQIFDLNPQQYNEFVQLGSQAYNEILAQSQPAAAQMSGAVDHELRAEFAEQRNQKEIGQALKDLEQRASAAYDSRIITPHERYLLTGGLIEDREDKVAAFSQFCTSSKTDPWQYIYGANFALNLLEQRGAMAEFAERQEDDPLSTVGDNDLEFEKRYRQRRGYS